jgi:ATP-binding cassette subfamily B protein
LAIEAAQLRDLLENLPDGLQTSLGEGGALVSGGEGQRVRFGRAILRSRARLILLDEPFRGLDREQRRRLLSQARRLWSDKTLLCVTHDVSETQSFDRVLVVEGGKVVEDNAPSLLAGQEGTRYRAMLDAEEAVRTGLWANDGWRSLSLRDGLVVE